MYKVLSWSKGYDSKEPIEGNIAEGDLILVHGVYWGEYTVLHIRTGRFYTRHALYGLLNKGTASIVRDYSVKTVSLYVDNEVNPEYIP